MPIPSQNFPIPQPGQARKVLTQINTDIYDKTTQLFKNHNNQRRSASKNFIVEYYAKKYNNIKIKVLNELAKISKEFEDLLKQQPGVINVENNLSKKRTNIYFNINKEKAGMYGVPIYEIDKTIRTAVNGMTISKYRDKEGKEYDIEMRMPTGQDFTIEDFDKVYVQSMSGKIIPLNQLATLEFKNEPGQISRLDLQRSVIISPAYCGRNSFCPNYINNPDNYWRTVTFNTTGRYHVGTHGLDHNWRVVGFHFPYFVSSTSFV